MSGMNLETITFRRNLVAFWLLGLFNNSSYVVMNAGATEIADGGVGIVYLANILPTMLVKTTAPFWFDKVSYRTRMILATMFMVASFVTVSYGQSLGVKILGVVFASFQSGMGEASLLALSTCYTTREALLTAWSSGTGFAGVFGYFWLVTFHTWGGLSFRLTIMLANVMAIGYLASFLLLLRPATFSNALAASTSKADDETPVEPEPENDSNRVRLLDSPVMRPTFKARLKLMASLWPFTIPLFLVYFSEYTMQAGVWAAIGFPITSKPARKRFYGYSNWMYQVGVFVSRSSGTIWHPGRAVLWAMPILQTVLLGFFFLVAAYQFWYDYSLLVVCFVVGLLGGAVYVNAFKHVAAAVPKHMRELAMSGASMADTFGIALADLAAIFLQACLFKIHHIPGAVINVC